MRGHVLCSECIEGVDACSCSDVPTTFVKLFEEESRACGICFTASPEMIRAYADCGHLACAACFMEIYSDSINNQQLHCPFCITRTETVAILLVGDLISSTNNTDAVELESSPLMQEIDDSITDSLVNNNIVPISPIPSHRPIPSVSHPFRRFSRFISRKIRRLF